MLFSLGEKKSQFWPKWKKNLRKKFHCFVIYLRELWPGSFFEKSVHNSKEEIPITLLQHMKKYGKKSDCWNMAKMMPKFNIPENSFKIVENGISEEFCLFQNKPFLKICGDRLTFFRPKCHLITWEFFRVIL